MVNMTKKILIINTGGTIGMVHSEKGNPNSPLRPAASWSEVSDEHPLLKRFDTDYCQTQELIDSSDFSPEIWIEIAKIIEKNYDNYLGFVILHGTDTMAFTASALSFMLKNLSKPIVLTGSQVPLQKPRSDALQNLITSIMIAGNEYYGIKLVPEVSIFFRDTLLRGNRSRKLDASNYFGFSSPNFSPLAEVGGDINIIKDRILKSSNLPFFIDTTFNKNVMIIEIFPGLRSQYIKNIVDANPDLKGIILKTYGNGNAPTNKEFLDVIRYINSKGIVIIDITQCTHGFVKMGLYEASAKLVDANVISGGDLTPEAAITKLMYLLGKNLPFNELKNSMQVALAGEQTINQYDWGFSPKTQEREDNFIFFANTSLDIDSQYLLKSVVRIKNISVPLLKGESIEFSVTVMGDVKNENIYRTNYIKKFVKFSDNMDKDVHLSFNHTIMEILKKSHNVKISISAPKKFLFEKLSFSIFTERL